MASGALPAIVFLGYTVRGEGFWTGYLFLSVGAEGLKLLAT